MNQGLLRFISLAAATSSLFGCTYNPFVPDNHTTGSPVGAAVGAGAGAGFVAAWNGPKPLMGIAGITGGMIGYYATTLRFDAGGVMQSGGEVYKVGQFVGIYIPTDKLFVTNTAELLPQAKPILDSAATVLQRYPNNNIIISGNSSGFGTHKRERQLSLLRAKEVAAYLWNTGVNNFVEPGSDLRKLNYVAYGNYFPIASDLTNKGVRMNSRIQITSYPTSTDLQIDRKHMAVYNVGSINDNEVMKAPPSGDCTNVNDMSSCFKDD